MQETRENWKGHLARNDRRLSRKRLPTNSMDINKKHTGLSMIAATWLAEDRAKWRTLVKATAGPVGVIWLRREREAIMWPFLVMLSNQGDVYYIFFIPPSLVRCWNPLMIFMFAISPTEHSDPSFPVPLPYITECQSMPGYNSVTIRDCVLFQSFQVQSLQVSRVTKIIMGMVQWCNSRLHWNGHSYWNFHLVRRAQKMYRIIFQVNLLQRVRGFQME